MTTAQATTSWRRDIWMHGKWASWMQSCSCSHGFNSLLLWDKYLCKSTWIRCLLSVIHNKIHNSIQMCDPGRTVVLNLRKVIGVLMLCQLGWLACAHILWKRVLKNATFQAQDQAQLKTLRMTTILPLRKRNAHKNNASMLMSSEGNVYHVHC